jgi:hypothetical protein
MEFLIIYAIIVGGLLFLFYLRGIINLVNAVLYSRKCLIFLSKYLYPYIYHRRRFLPPISRLSAIL